MLIFCYLVEHQGKVLSKSDVIEALWPNQTLDPELVTKAVFEIRKILNDDPKEARFIETVPRKGYVFIGQVSYIKSQLNVHKRYLVATFICIPLLLMLWYLSSINTTPARIITQIPAQHTIRHTSNLAINRLSLDKTAGLLFIENRAEEPIVFSHDLNTYKNTELETIPNHAKDITWSSDSYFFLTCNEQNCTVTKKSKQKTTSLITTNENVLNFAISEQQDWLALQILKQGRYKIALFNLIKPNSKLYFLKSQGFAGFPSFLDNKLIYLTTPKDRKNHLAIYDISSQQTEAEKLPVDRISRFTLLSKKRLAIVGRFQGEYAIWLYDLSTKDLARIKTIDPDQKIQDLIFQKESSTLYYITHNSAINIGGRGNINFNVEHPSINLHGIVLHRLNTMIFSSNRSGNYEIWSNTDSQESKLTNIKASYIHTIKVDAKEQFVAFSYTKNNNKFIAIYSLTDQTLIKEISIRNDSYLLNWDHTSTYLLLSERGEKNYDLVSMNIRSERKETLAINAGITALTDTKGIFYYTFDEQAIVYQTNQGTTKQVLDLKNKGLHIRANSIKLTEQHIFYLTKVDDKQIAQAYEREKRKSAPLFMLSPGQFVTDIGIIDDEAYIVFDEPEPVTSQIVALALSEK